MAGFNSCCFAYGQTGSGKTFTIFGEGGEERRGLLPRAVEYLFERIQERRERKEIGMVCSFLEIYMDQVRDLGQAYKAERTLVRDRETEGEKGTSSIPLGGSIRTGGATRTC